MNSRRSQVGKGSLLPLVHIILSLKPAESAGASCPSPPERSCSRALPRSLRGAATLALLLSVIVSGACRGGGPKPVPIDKDDMCSFCRMAISEKRYAAELIDNDGQVFKFDDITCMTNYVKDKGRRNNVAAFFVMDFGALQWVNAEEAHCVRSMQFRTPMSGGIVAFKDPAAAEGAVVKYHGSTVNFADLLNQAE